MALTAGSVSVDQTTGDHSGSGLALAILNEILAAPYQNIPAIPGALTGDQIAAGWGAPELTAAQAAARKGLVQIKNFFAGTAIGVATAVVAEIQAHADVTVIVGTLDAGLQRTPNPNDADTATQAPLVPKVLSGTVA